ncbi:ATP-binding cassette, subfamily B [Sporobacter termitidis DSM 10068]|uniref:ATP-binding cassette, subfamily B n=2 Tax=Sporobacter TaxID=44748 RepID=A0A1M5ZKH6_9FIRM|nr:ATP-binding cassette, subfamily B [Sporobacter termitidis DSM 10068]
MSLEMAKRSVLSVISVLWSGLSCVSALITLICALLIIGKVSIPLTVLLVAVSLPSAILNQTYTKKLYQWNLTHIKEERQMNYLSFIMTDKSYAQELRLFNIGDFLKEKFKAIWGPYFAKKKKLTKKRVFLVTLLSVLPQLCILGILAVLSLRIINGNNTVGDYSLYSGLLAQFLSSLMAALTSIINIYDQKLRIHSFEEFEAIPNAVANTGTEKLNEITSIEFNDVSFRYPGTEKEVLQHISFSVKKHEKVCLVGLNGAGKSTLIKLLLRFYDAESGNIRINGADVKNYEITSLRKAFSCLFQLSPNYAFTLRENITISDIFKNADENDVLEALYNSSASDILDQMADGLDSYLSRAYEENGTELSGGQHQKIALARTFFRNSSVLILDEPSASLDPESEYKVFCSLEKLSRGKTAIFTSHRLSNTIIADKIIVIENGTVIEQGTHDELMEKASRYATFFTYQADRYIRKK